jgi:hypothetical protein
MPFFTVIDCQCLGIYILVFLSLLLISVQNEVSRPGLGSLPNARGFDEYEGFLTGDLQGCKLRGPVRPSWPHDSIGFPPAPR